MANSLHDQLLKAGLVDKTQVSSAKKSKHKKVKQRKTPETEAPDENKLGAQRAMATKAERDRELNRQQAQRARQKAIAGQIRQLIEINRRPRDDGDLAYNFADDKKIRTLFVSETTHEQLTSGRLAVVKFAERYEIVPAKVADQIRIRDAACVIVGKESDHRDAEDDGYSDYQIPDDLMW